MPDIDKIPNRQTQWKTVVSSTPFDICIIGGGSSGIGVLLDAVSRGLKCILLEKDDFASGTSSKSTKLIHGGLRYLAQGDFKLVYEGLHEREWLFKAFPHLVFPITFLLPTKNLWEKFFYGSGLSLYKLLAGRRQRQLNQDISQVKKSSGLSDAYHYLKFSDGQFDDARLTIEILKKCCSRGAVALNYIAIQKFHTDKDKIAAIDLVDKLTQERVRLEAKVFVDATGVFTSALQDDIGKDSHSHGDTDTISITASRGSHIVLPRHFLDGDQALFIPKTSDGRVAFLIPWMGVCLLGTTDLPDPLICKEPQITEAEIDYLLNEVSGYLKQAPTRKDILSTFCGLRPLIHDPHKKSTKDLSRTHKIVATKQGLVRLLGGKWTSFRKMGEDTLDYINKHFYSGILSPSRSKTFLPIQNPIDRQLHPTLDIKTVWENIPLSGNNPSALHPDLKDYSWDHVDYVITYEAAESVEDILGRRLRAVYLNAKAANEIAREVALRIKKLRGYDDPWVDQEMLAWDHFIKSYQ